MRDWKNSSGDEVACTEVMKWKRGGGCVEGNEGLVWSAGMKQCRIAVLSDVKTNFAVLNVGFSGQILAGIVMSSSSISPYRSGSGRN